jgi:carboxypeptidase Taq
MSTADTLQKFRSLIRKIQYYNEALGVLYWDMRTGAPRKGMEGRSEVVGMLSGEMFRLSVSDEMGEYLEALSRPDVQEGLSEVDRRLVEVTRKDYERSRKIPQHEYEAYVILTSKAEAVWEEAKANDDFAAFRPYLEQIVETIRHFITLWGSVGHPYNTLLDDYEPGMTVDTLDRVFGELREKVVPLAAAISEAADKPDAGLLLHPIPRERQRKFSEFILREMGYDFSAGRLDVSVHPFATGLNPGDVRITTNFLDNDFTFALFSTVHEGGHALYEQNISAELAGTTLCTGTSMGIHESQSRFWENFIGRSRPFWERYYRDLQEHFPEAFGGLALDAFYRAINAVNPSLIRIEADELTYNLHIMVRYELEKELIGGTLPVSDLPEAWNEKYRACLGITPPNDKQGVLQDVHWSGGAFGYFPSYSLGNMYAAQIMNALRREMPDLDSLIAQGRLAPIKEWLTDKVYRYGKLRTPEQLIRSITGEPLNPGHLIEYFERKFKPIYNLA